MEPESSSPQSQQPATCLYSEQARSSPCPNMPIPEYPSQYYPPFYDLVFPVVSFSHVSPPKPCARLSFPMRATTPPISFFSI